MGGFFSEIPITLGGLYEKIPLTPLNWIEILRMYL